MMSAIARAPDWDLEQLEIILDDAASWQLVSAGPGTGKSAVACQRIASLLDDGVPPSRILLVSFTRTAVAELRDRIISYAVAGERARSVRISTVDSHAWSLRVGFDDEPLPKTLGDDSYDLSIARVVELFRSRQPDLLDFMSAMEHVIIDEAQDVVGVRADLVLEMLRSLPSQCGVTILADPAQAIYGFTSDDKEDSGGGGSLLSRLSVESPRRLVPRQLEQVHRIQDQRLMDVFLRTRKEVEQQSSPVGHVDRVLSVIRETCLERLGATSYEAIATLITRLQGESLLVLFRRRADVLLASSYCSQAGIQHRLRMSGAPVVIRPWIGWLFAEFQGALITESEFVELWDRRLEMASSVFEGESKEEAWALLHRLAAAQRPGVIDLVHLRRILSRSRPPVEVCLPELGTTGPILGTIHASKGREADTVVLVMPSTLYGAGAGLSEVVLEEGRVYYVGATRARKALITAGNSGPPVGYLDSRRVFRRLQTTGNRPPRVQVEVGRAGDVDLLAHLSWTNAISVQHVLAMCVGRTIPLQAVSLPEHDYDIRLVLSYEVSPRMTQEIEVGQMSESFRSDLGRVWSCVDEGGRVKPAPVVQHLHMIGVTSVALSDDERGAVQLPLSRSGFALAPVVKGFPVVQFLYRGGRRYPW